MTDDADGRYAQHPGIHPRRRAEDRLPADFQPRYSQSDLARAIAEGVREALEVRDSDPTGIHDLPKNDPELAAFKPTLGFTARVVSVLVALALATVSVAAAVVWIGNLVDGQVKGVLVRSSLICPDSEPGQALDPRYACKTLPQQLGEIRDAQDSFATAQRETVRKLDVLVRRSERQP